MYRQDKITETELLLLLTREDEILIFKEGKVSKAEFLEILDKLKLTLGKKHGKTEPKKTYPADLPTALFRVRGVVY